MERLKAASGIGRLRTSQSLHGLALQKCFIAENNAILDDFLLQLADSVDVLHIQQSKPFQYRKFR